MQHPKHEYKQPEKLTSRKRRDLSYNRAVRHAEPKLIPPNILAHAAQRWKSWSISEKIAYTTLIILAVSSSVTMAYYCFTYGFSEFYEMLDGYLTTANSKPATIYPTQTNVGFFRNHADLSSPALPPYLQDIEISWEPLAEKALAKTEAASFKRYVSIIRELLPQTMQPKLLQKIFGSPNAHAVKIKVATPAYLGRNRARYEFVSKTIYIRYEKNPNKQTLLRALRNELNHVLNQKTNEIIFMRHSLTMPPDRRQGSPFLQDNGGVNTILLKKYESAIAAGDAKINEFKNLFEKKQSGKKMLPEETTSLLDYLTVIDAYQPLTHYTTLPKIQLQQLLATGSFQESTLPGIKYLASKQRNPLFSSNFYIRDLITNDVEGTVEVVGTFAKNEHKQEKARAFFADYTEMRRVYYTREQANYADKPDALMIQITSDIEEWEPEVRGYFYEELCKLQTECHFEHPEQEDYCAIFKI
jgi:hypothetical protein